MNRACLTARFRIPNGRDLIRHVWRAAEPMHASVDRVELAVDVGLIGMVDVLSCMHLGTKIT